MTITLLVVGKTEQGFVEQGISLFAERIKHYTTFTLDIIPDIKQGHTLPRDVLKEKEGELILKKLHATDTVVLLDERGKHFTSRQFSAQLEKYRSAGTKRVVFVIGGAFGFSQAVYDRATASIALSQMTFSHQLVRVIFVEQLYRGFTILRNEQYHHD